MPIDRDYDRPHHISQQEKDDFSALMSKDLNEWSYSVELAVVDGKWRNTLLEQTGAPDIMTLGSWVVKAQQNDWTSSQMLEEMKKSLKKK